MKGYIQSPIPKVREAYLDQNQVLPYTRMMGDGGTGDGGTGGVGGWGGNK